MSFLTTPRRRTAAGLAGLVLFAFPLAACGDDSESGDGGERVSAIAEIDDVNNGKTTEIKLDQGFIDALGTLQLTPDVLGDADLTPDGSLVFPITGGNVSLFEPGSVPNYVVGQLQHENSGLSLTAGDTVVQLRNFNVDPGVSRVYGDVLVDNEVAATSAYLFRLDGSTLMDLQEDGTDVILEGTTVYVSDVAAELLNNTFGTEAVNDQLEVGIAKITVNTNTN